MSFQKLPFLDVFEDATGGSIKTPQTEFLEEGEFPVVDQGQALVAGFVNDRSRVCRVNPPVIVFGDHTRVIKYVDFEFAMGADGTKVLVPKVESDTKYLYYALKAIEIPAAGYSRHYKFLKETQIPLPPLPEQRRIAEILDKVDALRAKRRQALAQLDTLTQSIFLDMFGDPVTNPMGWEQCVVGDVVHAAKDGPHVSPAYAESGVPFLSTRHIKLGEVVWEDLKYIEQDEANRQWKKCKPEFGDILYTKGGTTGIAARVTTSEPFAVWVHVALLKPIVNKVHPIWIEAMLNSAYCYTQSQRYTHGIANRDLGLKRMVKIQMYLPPLAEQRCFAAIVESIEQQKASQRAHLAELDTLFASMQSRAFRGEL